MLTRLLLGAGAILLVAAPEAGAQAPEDRSFVYLIDLAKPAPREPVVVPAGKELKVGLDNIPLAPEYRVVVAEAPSPSQTRPLPRGRVPSVTVKTPACVPVKSELDAALAETDEAGLAGRLRAFDQHLAAVECGSGEKIMMEQIARHLRPSLSESRTLRPRAVVSYTIERLSRAGTVERSWQVKFVGGAPDLGWKYPDEETFLVAAIAQRVAGLAAAARPAAGPPGQVRVTASAAETGARSFRIELKAGRPPVVVKPDPHLWAPSAYAALAKAALADAKPGPRTAAAAAPSALETLTDLRAGVIEQENRRLSERLTRDPQDFAAHEEAGLVLAAFALREAADTYSDTRPVLSRMAAHLAVARALRGPAAPTPAGRMAEIALDTLAGRQTPALAALAGWTAAARPAPAETAWIRALSLRNNGDWRVLARPADATMIERVMYFDAVARGDSPLRALQALGESPLEDVPDWGRAVLSRSFAVEAGHQFATSAVARELADLDTVWRVSHPSAASVDALRAALALWPTSEPRDGQVHVLEWADWGAMAARHVHAANEATTDFLRRLMGVPVEADAFDKEADRQFGGLPLHSLFWLRERTLPDGARCAALTRVINDAPERMTIANWDRAFNQCGRTHGLPTYGSWFSPPIPSGTAYEPTARLRASETKGGATLQAAEALRTLAPYDTSVLFRYILFKYGDKPEPAVYLQEFGRQAEYQLSAMRTLERRFRNDPARRRPFLEQMCDRSADSCLSLGRALRTSDPAAAERAYARAVDQALDRVRVANTVQWLVDRYHDTGRADEALKVARMAADTYSQGGLQTLARHLERLQRYDEALEYYQRLADRYDQPLEVEAFFARNRGRLGEKQYGARVAKAMAGLFPEGVQKVALADFQGQKPDGATIVNQTEPVAAWGLKGGDVIVALDGYRVKNHHQYGAIKGWSTDPKMRLTVFHGRGYKEVEGERKKIVYFLPEEEP